MINPMLLMAPELARRAQRSAQLNEIEATPVQGTSLPRTTVQLPINLAGVIPFGEQAQSMAQGLFNRPNVMSQVAGRVEDTASRNLEQSLAQPIRPAISNSEGNLMVGLGMLAALLGTPQEQIMGAAGSFLGGRQQARDQERAQMEQAAKLRFDRQARQAERLDKIASRNLQAQLGEQEMKARNAERAAGLIVNAGRAANPQEAAALLREARRLGGTFSRGDASAMIADAEGRAEIERDKVESIARDREIDNIRRTGIDPLLKQITGMRFTDTNRQTIEGWRKSYEANAARLARLGVEMPPFEALVTQSIRAAEAEGRMSKMEADMAFRAIELQQNGAKQLADIQLRVDRLKLDREREARMAREAAQKGDAGAAKTFSRVNMQIFNSQAFAYRKSQELANNQAASPQQREQGRMNAIYNEEELRRQYSFLVSELGADHEEVRKANSLLKQIGIMVRTPAEEARAIDEINQALRAVPLPGSPQIPGGAAASGGSFPRSNPQPGPAR